MSISKSVECVSRPTPDSSYGHVVIGPLTCRLSFKSTNNFLVEPDMLLICISDFKLAVEKHHSTTPAYRNTIISAPEMNTVFYIRKYNKWRRSKIYIEHTRVDPVIGRVDDAATRIWMCWLWDKWRCIEAEAITVSLVNRLPLIIHTLLSLRFGSARYVNITQYKAVVVWQMCASGIYVRLLLGARLFIFR